MNHVQRARLHQVLTYLVDIFRDSEGGERGLTRWEVVEGSAADSEHIDGLLAVLVGSGLVVYEDVTETRRFYRLAIQPPAQGNGDGPESGYIEVRLANGMEKRFAREDRALADKWIDESIRDEQERMEAADEPKIADDGSRNIPRLVLDRCHNALAKFGNDADCRNAIYMLVDARMKDSP